MPGFILTGAPGSGKTAILRQLELNGHAVVEEAATDVIALQHALGRPEPWRQPTFVEQIVDLQRSRQTASGTDASGSTFFDRSPVCTLALCRHLRLPPPARLTDEIRRIAAQRPYELTAFFVRNLGFVQATAARRMTLDDALVFERTHELTYRELGFELVDVPAAQLRRAWPSLSGRSSDSFGHSEHRTVAPAPPPRPDRTSLMMDGWGTGRLGGRCGGRFPGRWGSRSGSR